ncbi:MAG TPA: hypothetical protein PLV01_02970 [Candidatus Kapabacteria bacterium]|nr:hypothetical protein [Candidatus Kapabacteria bacterium]
MDKNNKNHHFNTLSETENRILDAAKKYSFRKVLMVLQCKRLQM